MTTDQYYIAPPKEIFDEIKREAIKIWQTYDDTYGYQTEKVGLIKDIENINDNAWYIVAMFDSDNQDKLCMALSPEARLMVEDAINS